MRDTVIAQLLIIKYYKYFEEPEVDVIGINEVQIRVHHIGKTQETYSHWQFLFVAVVVVVVVVITALFGFKTTFMLPYTDY